MIRSHNSPPRVSKIPLLEDCVGAFKPIYMFCMFYTAKRYGIIFIQRNKNMKRAIAIFSFAALAMGATLSVFGEYGTAFYANDFT